MTDDTPAPKPKEQRNDDVKTYARPDFFETARNEIAYHFDEQCRIIADVFEGTQDPRLMSIVKLKLEEAMVWMLHAGVMRKPVQQPPNPS